MNCVSENSIAIFNYGRHLSYTSVYICGLFHLGKCKNSSRAMSSTNVWIFMCDECRYFVFSLPLSCVCFQYNNFVTPSGIHSNVFSIWEVLAEVLTLRFLSSISIILSEPSLEWWSNEVWKNKSHGSSICNSSLIHLCSVYWSIYKLKTAVTNYVSYDDLCRLIL